MTGRRLIASLAAALALSLVGAATAAADTSESSNWAGYAVHRSGVNFKRVVGQWTQPTATCQGGEHTYSSVWVGIGGYSATSPALEQIGTELDCTASGRAVSSAWYELVPAPSHASSLIVHEGDRMRASVSVAGHEVTLVLSDLTRHRSFIKRVKVTLLDTTSAEWIVEAPSACESASDCQTLPLADFGSAAISAASATPAKGRAGAIVDPRWTTSEISLAAGAPHFVAGGPTGLILAAPSALSASDNAFTVTYNGNTTGAGSPTSTGGAPPWSRVRVGGPRR